MKAISAVKNGESVREAQRNYGVPKSTIADSLKKKFKFPGRPGRCQIIPLEVENKMANAVKEASKQGIGITRRQLLSRVGELSRKMKFAVNNGKPGKDWFDGFKRRHPDLSIRNQRNLRQQEHEW